MTKPDRNGVKDAGNLRGNHCQKNPRVHKIRVRNSRAGNGCANFMGAWKNCVLSAGKPVSIKFLVLGGAGILGFFLGGGSDFIFIRRNPKGDGRKGTGQKMS